MHTTGVNECPAPTARTVRPASAARSTTPTRSASLVGRGMLAGAHRWLPAQLRQMSWRDRSGLVRRDLAGLGSPVSPGP